MNTQGTGSLTLEDVGRLAGVSRSTVSRVINGQPTSQRARDRVSVVIGETGFTPHAAARSLASNRTGVIGVVIPNGVQALFGDPYFGLLLDGMSRASNQAGTVLSLFIFHDEDEEERLYPRVVRHGLVDGVLITASRMGDPLLDRLAEGNMPFVVVGRPDRADGVPHVDVDNHGGARGAAQHLCDLGRLRIACVAAPEDTAAGVDRLEGFVDGLRSRGMVLAPDLLAHGDYSETGGYDAMRRILPGRPDAVFVASDQMAAGALRALREAGLDVPDDVAVVGFDGLSASASSTPPLTTVSQPVGEVGHHAVRLLLDRIGGEGSMPIQVVLPTQLLIRGSCGGSASSLRSGDD